MKNSVEIRIIQKMTELADLFREAANEECNNNDAYRVYENMKESLSYETKIRKMKLRRGL